MKTADVAHFTHKMEVVSYRHQIIGENKRIIKNLKYPVLLSNQP